MTLRFRLGLFDDPASQPYEHFSPDIVRSSEHLAAALDSTEQGLVLLKNEKGTLPIPEGRKIAVIGPHAASRGELLGNYLGQICPGERQSFACVQTIFEALANLTQQVTTAPGLPGISSEVDPKILAEAVATAKAAEYIILALGREPAASASVSIVQLPLFTPPFQLHLRRPGHCLNRERGAGSPHGDAAAWAVGSARCHDRPEEAELFPPFSYF